MANDDYRTREKRFLLTPNEELQMDRLIDRIRDKTDSTVTLSHLVRGSLRLITRLSKEFAEEAVKARLERPHNSDLRSVKRFEEQLADVLFRTARRRRRK